MVAPTKPRKVRALGKEPWFLISALADINAATVAELNAATALNISCSLLSTFGGVTGESNKITLPAYLCEEEQFQANDRITYSMSDIEGGFDPQAAVASDDKKLFEALRDGFVGWAWTAPGLTASTLSTITIADFVTIVPVDIDKAYQTKSGDGPEGIFTFRAGVAITGPIAQLVNPAA